MTQIALAVGVSVPNIDPDSAALAMVGALAIAYGTSHVHIGRTGGRDANINMVCSESVRIVACYETCEWRKDAQYMRLCHGCDTSDSATNVSAILPLYFDINRRYLRSRACGSDTPVVIRSSCFRLPCRSCSRSSA